MITPIQIAPQLPEPAAANDRIHFAIDNFSLGSILIAASAKGICALTFDDNDDLLQADLRKRFSQSELSEIEINEDPRFTRAIDSIENFETEIDLELDLRGTIFQQLVWKALQEIPLAKTSTYTEIAAKIGRPKAFRAVAQACASNPIAILVPCHRVLRSDGSLSGYRWGTVRKEKLLQMEKAAVSRDA